MNERLRGIFIIFLSIVCLSPDTLFFRLLNISAWDVLFWRGMIVTACVFIFLKVAKIPVLYAISKNKLGALLIIIFDAASNVFFYSSLRFTTVANTLLILSSVPIIAAVLGRVFLGDSTKIRTWIAIIIICISVALLTSGSQQKVHMFGDLLALGAAFSLAFSLVAIRQCRPFDMTPCVGFANVLTSLVVLPLVNPLSIFGSDNTIVLLLFMGIFSALAMVLLTISPRYINAAEVSLFFPLETIFGGVLVWYFIGETINRQTLIAGIIIIGTIFFYSWREFQEYKKTVVGQPC